MADEMVCARCGALCVSRSEEEMLADAKKYMDVKDIEDTKDCAIICGACLKDILMSMVGPEGSA